MPKQAWEMVYINQGVIQAKAEVGHQIWDLWVWDPKLLNSKKKIKLKKTEAKEKKKKQNDRKWTHPNP